MFGVMVHWVLWIISAQGAANGAGGFISSKLNLQVNGNVNVSGFTPGNWLLDPADIEITNANVNPDVFANPGYQLLTQL